MLVKRPPGPYLTLCVCPLQVKLSSLLLLDELHRKLGEDYLPLLPDTVPFLAELMEGA